MSEILLGSGYRRYCTAVYGRVEQAAHRWRLTLSVGDDEHALARLLESLSSASAEELLSELETAALGNPRRQPRDDVAMLMLRVPIGGEVDHERPAESADARS